MNIIKHILLILFILRVFSSNGQCNNQSNYYLHGIKGRIKSFKEVSTQKYEGDSNVYNKNSQYIVDEKRNVIEINEYLKNDSVKYKLTFNYDSFGNETANSFYNSLDSSISKINHTYDNNNNQTERIEYYGNKIINRKLTKYDESGNKIEDSFFEPENNLHYKHTYTYDEKKNVVLIFDLTAKDTIIIEINEYQYNKKGLITEHVEYSKYGIPFKKHTYEYDDEGNTTLSTENTIPLNHLIVKTYKYDNKKNNIEETQAKNNKLDFIYIYKYDSLGNIIENNLYNSFGELTLRYKYKFDNENNIIEITKYDRNNLIESKTICNYIYDSLGNWIKKTEYSNSTLIFQGERSYEYY